MFSLALLSEDIYLGWGFLFFGLAIVFAGNPQTAPRDVTLIRLVAGVALILFGLLRLLHVV